MHTKPMPESAGTFSDPEEKRYPCPKCKEPKSVTCTRWDSSCGGYEDYKYECTTKGCTYVHWVDGPDS